MDGEVLSESIPISGIGLINQHPGSYAALMRSMEIMGDTLGVELALFNVKVQGLWHGLSRPEPMEQDTRSQ